MLRFLGTSVKRHPECAAFKTAYTLASALAVYRLSPRKPKTLSKQERADCVASMDDSQITLNVRPWADGANYWSVYNDTLVALKAAFEKNGINIPFPQLTVHMDN